MRWSVLLGAGFLAVAFLVGSSEGGGEPKKKDEKAKGFLPQGWKDLGLSAAQKEDVYKLQTKFKAKLEALKQQEKDLKQEEKSELIKILTDDQKELLKKIVTGENKKETPKDKGK